jgi:prephenate dehydrogenase
MIAEPGTVCIVGLGLMGGSLALAWRDARAPWRITGVDRDPSTLAAALASGAIVQATTDLAEGVSMAGVVVLATPVRTILALLPEVGRHARPGALILDLGSSKAEICARMAGLPPGLQPVGGHPMCGTEHAGFTAAAAELYRGHPFVLCPLPRTAPESLALAAHLAGAAGARPTIVDPQAHDAAVAAISHLPYAVAATLVHAVEAGGSALAWSLAASGFRDTTRVAAGNVDVMLDALLTNKAGVLESLDAFAGELSFLRSAIAAGDEAALRSYLDAARQRRADWRGDTTEQGSLHD